MAVFRAAPRRDSRSLLIICVTGRKRTAGVIGDHHGRDRRRDCAARGHRSMPVRLSIWSARRRGCRRCATRSRGGSAAGECVIELYARASELQVDPVGRVMLIGCGAALFGLPLAVRFTAGRGPSIRGMRTSVPESVPAGFELYKSRGPLGTRFFFTAANRRWQRSLSTVRQNTKIIILIVVKGGYLD